MFCNIFYNMIMVQKEALIALVAKSIAFGVRGTYLEIVALTLSTWENSF